MQCYVYGSEKKPDYYLYLPQQFSEEYQQDHVPPALMDMLGELNFVIEFDLDESRELAQADARQVLKDIASNGYFLQMPVKDMRALEDQLFN
ncbi:MAG: YcgL domain-containing protein [Pseudomonadota bacterium]